MATEQAEAVRQAAARGKFRMLHTMLRVNDLDKSLGFYTGPLGMKLLRKRDYPDGQVHARLRRLRRRESNTRCSS